MDIIEMAEGGEWLAMGGTGTPLYVVNPDHVQRLFGEGYQVVSDPRRTALEQEAAPEAVESTDPKDEKEDNA